MTDGTVAADHKRYYPGAHDLAIRWTADRLSRRILGCQLVGHVAAQVAKRIDIVAAAIFSGLAMDDVGDLDLSYTPPFGSPWDALQTAAHEWLAAAPPSRAAA